MSLPKEPRQQMINMMYLVLTAMLAMNITREVLAAFQTINSSIESSNTSITDKNQLFYDQFDAKEAKNDADYALVKQLNDNAKEIRSKSDEIVKYLEGFKEEVVNTSGGWETSESGVKSPKEMENIDAATRIFVEGKKGDEIRKRLEEFYAFILSKVDNESKREAMKKQFDGTFGTVVKSDENPKGEWTYGTFHNIPVVAAMAMMSKFQNDVKTSEGQVVEHLWSKIGAEDLRFTNMMAIAVPKNSYALEGDEIEATITVGAYNKELLPRISSSAGAVAVKDGVGTLKFKASGAGVKTVNGTVSVKTTRGGDTTMPFKFDYVVGTAGASLQLDKMNVMYIGVPNPVTVSASGYNIQDVSLSIPGAKVTPTAGKGTYEVWVDKQTNDLPWSINAKSKTGGSSTVGSGKLRVKVIPPPIGTLGGKNTGFLAANIAKAQAGIIAKLENFDFEAKFTVLSFRFAYVPKNGQALEEQNVGARFNATTQTYMERSKAGDKWFVDELKVKGPDGTTRTIPPIAITLN